MDGLLLVDKPKGWTSFDVVAKIRGLLQDDFTVRKGRIKVGHGGTLDPMATGLLILLIGKATKCAKDISNLDKTYDTEVTLGVRSNTDDTEGSIEPVSSKRPSKGEIIKTLKSFIGVTKQVPPAYSAVKVSGYRAYKLARAGQELQLKPRPVTIYEIKNVRYRYPHVKFVATVSSGTYIRALARDLGAKLGTGAICSDLRRTKIGQYSVSDAVQIDKLNKDVILNRLINT